jgi:hypothetical protein
MSTRISAKETLAKLMATENILVEHANIPTAGFDLVNRKLLLPNWKNISDDVYTLLISHEVGHALFTPKDEWADEILKTKDYSLKQVVNVVEDVRIEKLIQQKYPGTVRAFKSGYDELEKANLFGTKNRDINSYGLIDRLNIHFKIGHFGYAKVPFSSEERPWIDRISSCKSFADVLKVAADLKQYVEEHPESQGNNEQSGADEQSDQFSPSDMQSDSSGQSRTTEHQIQGMQAGANPEKQDGNERQDSSQSGGNQPSNPSNNSGDGTESSDSDDVVFSETQKHFDSAIQGLVDKSVMDTKYANLPHIELDKIIVPFKTVHSQITNYYSNYHSNFYAQAQSQVETFKNSNKNLVNQLANLFEMKKKAKLDVKALVSKTGKLDMNRVHSYRYNDDVFKKLTTIPQGKSHGLVMFIDLSSSMHENLAGTFEQLLNLVLFCRRVNIPFDVYGFTDSYCARRGLAPLPVKPGCLSFEPNFCLRHYFSNKMTGVEFNQALQNVVCMMRYYSGSAHVSVPMEESLNTTPLVPTILTAIPLIQKFRAEYNLDIVNTIFLTDGEDTHGLLYHNSSGDLKYFNTDRYGSYRKSSDRCYLRDPKTCKQWQIFDSTKDTLNILREVAGVKTIGFHLVRKREIVNNISRYAQDYNQEQKHLENFKNHKFVELNNIVGYDAYYLIPSGSSLNVSANEFETNVDTTVDWNDHKQAKKAMKAVQKDFANFMKQKVTSRILLNRFIEHIS